MVELSVVTNGRVDGSSSVIYGGRVGGTPSELSMVGLLGYHLLYPI